jgi:hypothetical protein
MAAFGRKRSLEATTEGWKKPVTAKTLWTCGDFLAWRFIGSLSFYQQAARIEIEHQPNRLSGTNAATTITTTRRKKG